MHRKLRVLVIDDSAFNRQAITKVLSSHPEIEVVGRAFDGEEGLKLAAKLNPDLITLDIEMPRMDGFTFLRLLMSKMPTPVVVISSHSRKHEVFQALELGALDFIAKPGHHIQPDAGEFRDELIAKALTVRGLRRLPTAAERRIERSGRGDARRGTGDSRHRKEVASRRLRRLVCVGASTGGPPALESIVRLLPVGNDTAVLVAQHMPAKFTRAFAQRLNRMSDHTVEEAEGGMPIRPGHIYVAPGGGHMEVDLVGSDEWVLRIRPRESDDHYVPSIDRLFVSAARWFKDRVVGALLTGMGSDGAAGLKAIHDAGGRTIAESEETAIVYGMPKEAVAMGGVDEELPLPALVDRLCSLMSEDDSRES